MTQIERIQHYISNNGYGFTATEVAQTYGVQPSNVRKALRRLEELERISSTVRTKPGQNRIKEVIWVEFEQDPREATRQAAFALFVYQPRKPEPLCL